MTPQTSANAPRQPVYRAPMRARDREDPGAAWGLANGVVAIGRDPARIAQRFPDVPEGAFVWTRDDDGHFWLGQITGPMRTVSSPVGLPLVRDTRWLDPPFGAHEVPAAVAATYARGGRNFQRTHSETAERETAALWRDRDGR